jgi:O-antigen/teichoic acid export membrane protein
LKPRFKQLGKDAVVYGLGGIVAKGMGFFLLPLYTHYFVPADYGAIETLNVINSFLGALLVMGMDSAQSFFFFEQKQNGQAAQARVVTGILQFRLVWGSFIILVSMLLSPLLNTYFFNAKLTWEYFAAAFLGTLFTQFANQSAEVYRLLYKPWQYISINLGNTIVAALCSIGLITWLDWGIYGYFVGIGTGALIAAAFGWLSIRGYWDLSKWHFDLWPRLVRFGAPFVPVSLGVYLLNTTDRWFIISYLDGGALGIYAVADKFAMMLALLVTTFRQAWWPIAMDAIQGSDGPGLIRTMSRVYLGVSCVGLVLLTAMSPFLVTFLTTPAYYDAAMLIGVLAWQPLNFGFQMIAGIGIWKSEKTIWSPVSLGGAVIVNIILAFILVPLFGTMGAAVATAVAYFVWNVVTLLVSEKYWRVEFPLGVFGLQALTAIVSSSLILLGAQSQKYSYASLLVAAAGSFVILALTFPLSQIKWAWAEARKYIKSYRGEK